MNLKYVVPSILAVTVGLVAVAQPAAPKSEPEKTPAPQRGEPGQQQPGQPGQPGPGGPGGRGRQQDPNGPKNIEGSMKLINGGLRRLKAQITDTAKKDDNLRIINEMQRGAVIAKGLDPTEAFKKEKDAAKKAKMALEYRHHMIDLLVKLIALENQILDDKTEDAAKSIEALVKFKNENHEHFGVADD